MTDIKLRKVTAADRDQLVVVEKKSTPNLNYVPHVFDQFVGHERGEFSLAEVGGQVVGCAKFTVLPDGYAWVETLRVIPEMQGLGIGKRLYGRFFEIAALEGVTTMRMYTGVNNAVSKGLAERFGFKLRARFSSGTYRCGTASADLEPAFGPVTDSAQATALLMAHSSRWNGFLVLNRTFYTLTPELCVHLMERGFVYFEPGSGSVVVAGARFMPDAGLHLGMFAGDEQACLGFAQRLGDRQQVGTVSCLFPHSAGGIEQALAEAQFEAGSSDFIVMEAAI